MRLVNWGEGCGRPGVPTVYSRISFYRDFIENDVTLREDYESGDKFRPKDLPAKKGLIDYTIKTEY